MRSFDVRTTPGDIEQGTGGSQENSEDGSNRRRPTTGTGRHDTGCQTFDGRSPSFEDAVSLCTFLSGSDSPNSPPATRRPRTEVSQLPGLPRIRSSSVERLDCSTPDGHTTQTRHLSRQTVQDAVSIGLPEGSGLRPDFATSPGGRRDRAR